MQGFHTAFPNSTVTKGVALATQRVTKTCVEAFLASVEEGDPDQREHLRVALEACVLEALNKAVTE